MAASGAVGVGDGQVEATFEEAPAYTGGVEQIADILCRPSEDFAAGGGADIVQRVGIADERSSHHCHRR